MKTKILLLSFVLFSTALFAQSIQNAGFETWSNKIYYEEPDSFQTSNMQTYFVNGSTNVTKITDHQSGTYAARLETVLAGTDTVMGMMIIGTPGPMTIYGGLPFNKRPDSLAGYVKYNTALNDTSNIVVFFKHSGIMIGVAGLKFFGLKTTYTRFSTPITWIAPGNPDSLAAIIVSSNLDYAKIPGTVFCVDNLFFKDSTAVVPFPNGDMEYWTPVSSEEPDNWNTTNLFNIGGPMSVSKTTDSHTGIYAIKCVNRPTIYGDTIGFFSNGFLGGNGPEGGMTVLLNPDKVTGYYKYLPVGLDTALAAVMTYHYDGTLHQSLMLDSNMIKLPGAITYTYFEIPLIYNNWPYADTCNIAFASGNIDPPGQFVGLGSMLYVDDLEITYKPMGVTETLFNNDQLVVYPNPATDHAFIQINVPSESDYIVHIYDNIGNIVKEKYYPKFNCGSVYKIDLSGLSAGIYILNVSTSNGNITKKVVVK